MAVEEDGENPALIYDGPAAASLLGKPPAPLVLIHDGGGTTFSYHCLDPIGRPLYGLQNSHLDQGGYWEGGVPEMAKHYIGLIYKEFPQGGDILLGGWSFGGMLSLEMTHQLLTDPIYARKPKLHVLGMVFIDTVCPMKGLSSILPPSPIIKSEEELKGMQLKEKVDLNMTHARMMISKWDLPKYEGIKVPPTILVRAKEYVEYASGAFVDHARHLRQLGWEEYNQERGGFIKTIIDVEGHHFNMFEEQHIKRITLMIARAANMVDD